VLRSADFETELPAHREAIAGFFQDAAEYQHDGMLVIFEDEMVATTLIEWVGKRIHCPVVQADKPYGSVLANLEDDTFKAVMPIDPVDQHSVWWEMAGSTS
jgi:hypothetical protein